MVTTGQAVFHAVGPYLKTLGLSCGSLGLSHAIVAPWLRFTGLISQKSLRTVLLPINISGKEASWKGRAPFHLQGSNITRTNWYKLTMN